MAVQAKNEQVREEGLEDSQGDSTLFQDSSFKSLISMAVLGPDTQDNPNLPLGDSLCHTGKGLGDLKGDDHLTGISTAWDQLDLRRNEFTTKPVFSQ